MSPSNNSRKKTIRYLRWAVKGAFLLLFIIPISYVIGAPNVSITSFFFGGLTQSYLMVPITQSVCVIWTSSFGVVTSGGFILCPLGGLQSLISGQIATVAFSSIIIAMLIFLIPAFILGNTFCSWSCPIGTMVDSFDKAIEKFLPKIEAKRVKRSRQNRQKKSKNPGNHVVCPSCPINRIMPKKGFLSYGIFASTLVGSAVFKFPVFCAVCPVGISHRGLYNITSLTTITGRVLPIIFELWAIPVVAILTSLRERRFWCRKLCPIVTLLSGAGALNPFIKPRVKEEKCVACMHCEKVCPFQIDLLDKGSLSKCTKCLDCYIVCDYNAIQIDLLGKPDAFHSIKLLYNRIRRRPS